MNIFTKKGLNILIIDDDRKDRIQYVESLTSIEDLDIENIDQENSPIKALEKIKEAKSDLIILDFMMDDGDGLEFLANLSQKQKSKTPIFFVTGYGNSFIAEDCVEAGARAYIDKADFCSSKLQETILRVIK